MAHVDFASNTSPSSVKVVVHALNLLLVPASSFP